MSAAQIPLFKVCSDCGEAKLPEDFVADKTKPSGRRGRCKVCQRLIDRQRSRQHATAERQRAWHARNPGKRREYQQRWEAAHPEQVKENRRKSNQRRRERELAGTAGKESTE